MKSRLMTALAASVVMFAVQGTALAQDNPKCDINATNLPVDATVSGSMTSIGWLAGARWGEGVMTLKSGEKRNFDILGVKLLETGAATTEFVGEVYNLKNVEDFVGTYYGAGAGITIVTGKGDAVINNAKCVIVKVKGTREGLQMSGPAPTGVQVSWD